MGLDSVSRDRSPDTPRPLIHRPPISESKRLSSCTQIQPSTPKLTVHTCIQQRVLGLGRYRDAGQKCGQHHIVFRSGLDKVRIVLPASLRVKRAVRVVLATRVSFKNNPVMRSCPGTFPPHQLAGEFSLCDWHLSGCQMLCLSFKSLLGLTGTQLQAQRCHFMRAYFVATRQLGKLAAGNKPRLSWLQRARLFAPYSSSSKN